MNNEQQNYKKVNDLIFKKNVLIFVIICNIFLKNITLFHDFVALYKWQNSVLCTFAKLFRNCKFICRF